MHYALYLLGKGALSLFLLGFFYLLLKVTYRVLYHLFLHEVTDDDEVEIEGRFAYAKAGYILSIIVLLLGAFFVAVYGMSIIWQLPITKKWLIKGITQKWVIPINRYDVIGLVQVGEMLCFIVGGLALSAVIRITILQNLFKIFLTDAGPRAVIGRMVHYCVFSAAMCFGLQYLGLGSYVWQLFLVVSFAITMGIKDIILDIFSGVWLLFERSIEPTHFIEVDGVLGTVLDIGVRKTLIKSADGVVMMPNRNLTSKTLTNWSKANIKMGICSFEFSLDNKKTIAQIKEVVGDIIKKETRVYNLPQSKVTLKKFSGSIATYKVSLAIKRKYLSEQGGIMEHCQSGLYEAIATL